MTIEDLKKIIVEEEREPIPYKMGYVQALSDVQKKIIKKVKECKGHVVIDDYDTLFYCGERDDDGNIMRCDACKALMELGDISEEMVK